VIVTPANNAARTLRQTYDEVMAKGIVDLVIVVDHGSRGDHANAGSRASGIFAGVSLRAAYHTNIPENAT
jgi:hypothetical protein